MLGVTRVSHSAGKKNRARVRFRVDQNQGYMTNYFAQ